MSQYSTPISRALATAAIEAAAAKEASYDHEGADAATADAEARGAVDGHPAPVDYYEFYGLTLKQACDLHAGQCPSTLLYLSLYYAGNDVLDWAKQELALPLPPTSEVEQSALAKISAALSDAELEALQSAGILNMTAVAVE